MKVEAISGISHDLQVDAGTWGILKGRVSRYLVKAERSIMGRSTMKHTVGFFAFQFFASGNMFGSMFEN